MTTTGKIDDWALHAYVDNEVSGEQKAEIEALLLSNPELMQRVDAWRRQREALKNTYDKVLAEPLPPSLVATLRSGGTLAAHPYLAMAAALLLLVLGGLSGWFLAVGSGQMEIANIARRALVAHAVYAVEVRHPVEVAAAEKDHLQSWLSKRVGTAFIVPDLTAEGYTLLGGRLLAAEDRPAAQLMYEDANRNRITIFLTAQPGDSETALHVEQQGKLVACYWLDGKLGFAVAGEMDRDRMMKLANRIYDQFEG
jgi:anti-sigma factor RsiW